MTCQRCEALADQVGQLVTERDRLRAENAALYAKAEELMAEVHERRNPAYIVEKLDQLRAEIEDWKAYTKLLEDDLAETAVMAYVHDWRSTRIEKGKELRKKLGLTE